MNSAEILIVCNRVNIGQSKKNNLYTHDFYFRSYRKCNVNQWWQKMVGYKGVVSVCDIIREVRPCDWYVGDVIKYKGALWWQVKPI